MHDVNASWHAKRTDAQGFRGKWLTERATLRETNRTVCVAKGAAGPHAPPPRDVVDRAYKLMASLASQLSQMGGKPCKAGGKL